MSCFKNKKLQVSMYLVVIIVSVVSFITILSIYNNFYDDIATTSQDIVCRAFIEAKKNLKFGIGFYLYELSNKCYVDKISVDLKKKDEAFNKIADEQYRCWKRYGEGEVDFLSDFKTKGSWCFICGEISYKDDENIKYSFADYVDWTKKNKILITQNEKKTYYDVINIKYTNIDDNKISEIREDIKNLLNENEEGVNYVNSKFIPVLVEQLNELNNLRLKSFNSEDKNSYVVFVYNRIDKDFNEKNIDALKGASVGIIGGIFGSIAIETLLLNTGCGLLTIVTGPGGVACFVLVNSNQAVKLIKRSNNVFKETIKFFKIKKIVSKISDFIIYSKTSRKLGMSLDDIEKLRKLDSTAFNNLKIYEKLFDELKIKNIDELNIKLLEKKDKIRKLNNYVSSKIDNNLINDEVVSAYAKKINKENSLLREYKSLKEMIDNDLKILNSKSSVEEKEKALNNIKKYLGIGFVASSGIAGAVSNTIYNKNYVQYVDVMTKEEFFRLCGTQRKNKLNK